MIQHSMADSDISKPIRRAKVGYARKRHQDPKTLRTRRYSQHPSLVLTGDWLGEAGFAIGSSVSVTVEHGRLTLQALIVIDKAPT